jgi:hypothetical protein
MRSGTVLRELARLGASVAVEAAANGSNVSLSALDGYEAAQAGVLLSVEDNAGGRARRAFRSVNSASARSQSELNSTSSRGCRTSSHRVQALGTDAVVQVTNVDDCRGRSSEWMRVHGQLAAASRRSTSGGFCGAGGGDCRMRRSFPSLRTVRTPSWEPCARLRGRGAGGEGDRRRVR